MENLDISLLLVVS
jgi:hypothetical protein